MVFVRVLNLKLLNVNVTVHRLKGKDSENSYKSILTL